LQSIKKKNKHLRLQYVNKDCNNRLQYISSPPRVSSIDTTLVKPHLSVIGPLNPNSPEYVVPYYGEPWDVFIVDDISVQRRLGHQVGPCEGRVHQGVTWVTKNNGRTALSGDLHRIETRLTPGVSYCSPNHSPGRHQ
jgi:hypothetical protein